LLHADVKAREIADHCKQRQILSVQTGRPVFQVQRYQEQRAEAYDQVCDEDRIGSIEDAAKHKRLIPVANVERKITRPCWRVPPEVKKSDPPPPAFYQR